MLVHIPGFDLALTAQSGQCFRFHQLSDDSFNLIAHSRLLTIDGLGNDKFRLSCDEAEYWQLWHNYFDLGHDYAAIGALPVQAGSYLHQAIGYAGGVRVLRQEPFETLIAFILSQRKSIPAIKTCMEALAKRYGEPIGEEAYAFPSPKALAQADEAGLKACGLGYRAPYIQKTAAMVFDHRIDLENLYHLDDGALEQTLLSCPGVGKKVAACVMLFAYHRLDAFPVDVWIQRVLLEHFPEGFPFSLYPGHCGILQQYLFCYARHQLKSGGKGANLST